MKNKDYYEKEIKELITELAIEKQKQISMLESELQVQTAILNIQYQSAMVQTAILNIQYQSAMVQTQLSFR